jgi:hypothetical protein
MSELFQVVIIPADSSRCGRSGPFHLHLLQLLPPGKAEELHGFIDPPANMSWEISAFACGFLMENQKYNIIYNIYL